MSTLYEKIELKKPGFFQRLLSNEPTENAIVELNNLLASKSVKQISVDEIAAISNKYKVDFYKKYSDKLKELYSTYLRHCLQDHAITAEETEDLNHLKNLLSLRDVDIVLLHNNVAGEIYKKTMNEIISDGTLDTAEQDALEQLQKSLLLPENVAKKISADSRQSFVNNYLQSIISDERLSEEEMRQFDAICSSLHAKVDFDNATQQVLEKYKLYWLIENGDLPIIDVAINLQKNENCFFLIDVSWLEPCIVTKSVRYGGPSVSIKIMKGVYYRTGSVKVQRVTSEETTLIDTGTLYITNKRIIFVGHKKNSNIKLDKILSLTPYSDAVEVIKDAGRNPVFQVTHNADIMAMILSRVINDL